jgi:hypothetical protein
MRAIGNPLQLSSQAFDEVCVRSCFSSFTLILTRVCLWGKQLCAIEKEDEVSALIGHDVPRTFHRLELFVNPKESFTQDLVRVLRAFARAKGAF